MKHIRKIETSGAGVLLLFLSLDLVVLHAGAQGVSPEAPISPACIALNRTVLAQASGGKFPDAEGIVSGALASAGNRSQHLCAGLILHNMSALTALSGRMAEAETFAERSVEILSETVEPTDPILLRSLQVLAATRFEQWKTAKAREAFNRMCLIRLVSPADRALVHGMAAGLLHVEGRWLEAESEYLITLSAWEESGLAGTPDAGAILIGLGSLLYIEVRRLDDAQRTLDRAGTVFASSRDTRPMDRVRVLSVQAALDARQGKWEDAEQRLQDAISIADREERVDPVTVGKTLVNYAYALRKNHHRREARSVEARAAALHVSPAAHMVVDVADLRGNMKRGKK